MQINDYVFSNLIVDLAYDGYPIEKFSGFDRQPTSTELTGMILFTDGSLAAVRLLMEDVLGRSPLWVTLVVEKEFSRVLHSRFPKLDRSWFENYVL